MKRKILLVLILFFVFNLTVYTCTNFLVTKGASKNSEVYITYSVDSHELYGELYFFPATKHKPGTFIKIIEWDTGKYLGKIKQVKETGRVIGNINEHQVSIGETTFGGRDNLVNPEGMIDYGSLMYIALQRATSARNAIQIMTSLVEEYGYHSSGESFSIADKNEAWIFEIIGKGKGEKGAIWVARKIPDGYVCAHANQARIGKFPLNDSKNCLYARDIIDFAREKGFFKGEDRNFSFKDAYAPLDFGAKRFCEARVWSFFNRVAPSLKIPINFVRGDKNAKPLPLWIKPDKKLGLEDLFELMRDHFEGTDFDLTKGIGAGPYKLPYRWRPLVWEHDKKKYFNERATSTQQTGWSFVSQLRSALPNKIGGVHWFGVDDSNSTVYIPMYCGMTKAPENFAVGNGNFNNFSWDSAFWVFNFVSNYAYLRYSDMIQDIKEVQNMFEGKFIADQKEIDKAALNLYQKASRLAEDYLTQYSSAQAKKVFLSWKKLGEFLIYKYLDGNKKNELGKVKFPGYPKEWYKSIIEESQDFYKMKTNDE